MRASYHGRPSLTVAPLDSAALRIAIADDHPLMRAALVSALGALQPGVEFVEAANHDEPQRWNSAT